MLWRGGEDTHCSLNYMAYMHVRCSVWGGGERYLLQDVFQLPFLALLGVDVYLVVVGAQGNF